MRICRRKGDGTLHCLWRRKNGEIKFAKVIIFAPNTSRWQSAIIIHGIKEENIQALSSSFQLLLKYPFLALYYKYLCLFGADCLGTIRVISKIINPVNISFKNIRHKSTQNPWKSGLRLSIIAKCFAKAKEVSTGILKSLRQK